MVILMMIKLNMIPKEKKNFQKLKFKRDILQHSQGHKDKFMAHMKFTGEKLNTVAPRWEAWQACLFKMVLKVPDRT